ncbi:diguanylate cyclase, partial [Vibrio splendidus]
QSPKYAVAEPLTEIERYRQSDVQWIVSVGMISEGTDIPRLQVCCHMSSVKTELYFRQVLGRILRVSGLINQNAWLYTYAEQSLVEFAERIEQDIPETCMFTKLASSTEFEIEAQCIRLSEKSQLEERGEVKPELTWYNPICPNVNAIGELSTFEELRLGGFKTRVISAFY